MSATWRARLGGVLGAGRYEVILFVLVAAYVAGAVGADAIAGPSFLAAAVLIGADLLTWQRGRLSARIGWVLLGIALAVAVAELALVDRADRVWGPIVVTLLTAAAATALLVRFLSERHTTITTIAAAACIYLLIGYSFGNLYLALDRVGSEPFLTSGERLDNESATYFSFVTLTTLGFGDLAPARGGGRSFVTLEAIVGQFYLAVAVARMIAALPQRSAGDPS